MSRCIYQIQAGQLESAASVAIDSASKESTSASFLISAGMAGVLDFLIGHGAKLVPRPPKDFKPAEKHASIRDIGSVRVVGLPTMDVTEGLADLYRAPPTCEEFRGAFDLSESQITGLVLDLRGNGGGIMTTPTCVASALLGPGLPLIAIATRDGIETIKSVAVKWRGVITVPVVVFINQETDQGAIALAAALQYQQRVAIVGEQRATISGTALSLFSTGPLQDGSLRDWFLVPTGDLRHIGGQRLATTGVRIDTSVSPKDDGAMMAAALAVFAARIR